MGAADGVRRSRQELNLRLVRRLRRRYENPNVLPGVQHAATAVTIEIAHESYGSGAAHRGSGTG